jgi:hypothetical protein
MKLNEKAFALAAGIFAAIMSVLHMVMPGSYNKGGMMMDGGMGGGGIVGLVVHFAVALVAGYVFAMLYNSLAKGK